MGEDRRQAARASEGGGGRTGGAGVASLAMSWVASYQTDGDISPSFPAEKANGRSGELVGALIAAGLWEERTEERWASPWWLAGESTIG